MPNPNAIVVTTVQEPTECMYTLARFAQQEHMQWIVVGDRKGPALFTLPPAELISIDQQRELPFKLSRLLPERHYARKNLGYLLAMHRGCNCIYETDDDTAPTKTWRVREVEASVRRVLPRHAPTCAWANIYEAYSPDLIWPRGLPLNRVRERFTELFEISSTLSARLAPIQQGLINKSPDVDAVWRLILDREFGFATSSDVTLPRGVWAPFNSQNTWWWKEAFVLMYLPSYCSFRMTDIWRSFVAQRCLWELGYELEFHSADTDQSRNEHDLMGDFEQEIPGYLHNETIRQTLEACELTAGQTSVKENLMRCYKSLVEARILERAELDLVAAWIEDCPD